MATTLVPKSTALLLFLTLISLQLPTPNRAFLPPQNRIPTHLHHLLHSVAKDDATKSHRITPLDPSSIPTVASFMIDSFWLTSPQFSSTTTTTTTTTTTADLSSSAASRLTSLQKDDLEDRYGARLGKRLLPSLFLTATSLENGDLRGVVGIETTLRDTTANRFLSVSDSETSFRDALSDVGPKRRRAFKNATPSEMIAGGLLSSSSGGGGDYEVVVLLSNLAVSSLSRRCGLGEALCREAELVAKGEWGFDKLFLKVEEGNGAARGLYEGKLGFVSVGVDVGGVGLRVDGDAGVFVEVDAETIIMEKDI